jgi:GcrA cell cycle regulator
MSVWTEAIDARLAALWFDGFSAAQVSSALYDEFQITVSRSAVIGRLFRRGISQPQSTAAGRAQSAKMQASGRPQVRRRKIVRLVDKGTRFDVAEVEAPPNDADWADAAADRDIPHGRSLLELTAGDCRWPVGDPRDADFFFCGGAALASGPYCACHARRAFTAPRAPRRRDEAGGDASTPRRAA